MMDAQRSASEPVAITGLSFKMPQDAVDETGLWGILEKGINVKTRWPADRTTTELFYEDGSKNPNTLPSHYAHFMREDPGVFDAPFFSITAKEAASMSPRQRHALEVAYHAFESAGVSLEQLRGSLTAVYGSSMSDDWTLMSSKDAESVPRPSITGNAPSLLPNKISWFFDLRGPSVHVDTACSSGLTALDLACQSILSGNAQAALVVGASTLLSPEASLHLANLNFLSRDGCCFSFDSRANGYGRGEGVVALYLKPLQKAVQEGDVVRAIVRATASNQDGRTPYITQPSIEAQADLIRHTYAKAGLDMNSTRYVEAHGTGTATGDPVEAKALGSVFGKNRSSDEPLFLGSIKANIGHLEGSSGPAGVVKAVMMLERGVIPPQALFKTLNPAIDAQTDNIKIPTLNTPWPDVGLRRISINSFGFGGANAHAVLDDAPHYFQTHNLCGFYRSIKNPMSSQHQLDGSAGRFADEIQRMTATANGTANGIVNGTVNDNIHGALNENHEPVSAPRLLIWSAADDSATRRMLQAYSQYYSTRVVGRPHKLNQLAYTLAARRSIMPWRSFAVVDASDEFQGPQDKVEAFNDFGRSLSAQKPLRVHSGKADVAFVFTGQGAQHAGMGLELIRYSVFLHSLQRSNEILGDLGSDWSLFDAISDQEELSTPEYSQPLCTALQIALVDLLQSFNIVPVAVVGHSSGEIAAAYSVGALSHKSACKIAYFRGKLAGRLAQELDASGTSGSMLSANLSEDDVPSFLESIDPHASHGASICVACVNSPNNVTLAGPAGQIDIAKAELEKKGIFAQKLNTGVAYHSTAMKAIAKEYAFSLHDLEAGSAPSSIAMVSSVTGQVVEAEILATPQYWVDNLTSPVQFAKALISLVGFATKPSSVIVEGSYQPPALTDLIEIGPHPALRRPVTDTVPQLHYHAWVQRSVSPLKTTLHLAGSLFCRGFPISITAVNGQDRGNHPYLVDCPAYPFDHSRRYWDETRISKEWRLREASPGFLLGRRVHDWNPLKPRWRNWLCVENIPWLGEHYVTGLLVVPGTGSVVIAIEAVRQTVAARKRKISGFQLKNVLLLAPLRVGSTISDAVETDVHLDQIDGGGEKESTWFHFQLFSHNEGRVTQTCDAQIQVIFEEGDLTPAGYERMMENERIRRQAEGIRARCTQSLDTRTFYKRFLKYGFKYGKSFTVVDDSRFDPIGQMSGTGKVNWNAAHVQADDSPVHPGILDGILQVLLATAPKGLENTSTYIPRRIGSLWVSNKTWCQCTQAVHVASTLTVEDGNPLMNFWALSDDDTPLCTIEKVKCAEISSTHKLGDDQAHKRLLYSIAWKPRLSSLRPGELQKICEATSVRLDNFDSEARCMANFFPKIEMALKLAARVALRTMSGSEIGGVSAHFSKYLSLLESQSTYETSSADDGENTEELTFLELEALLQECEAEYPQWFLFPAVARALPSILCGETDPLELMFATKAAETFYANVYSSHMLCGGFQIFLGLASHENPRLRILEVGAGTGSFTRHILSTLEAHEQATGGTSFAEYVFTDISNSFFPNAQVLFKDHLDRMAFKTWNIENDAADEQWGGDTGGYDIIFAGSVLHATSDIAKALRHLRKLLKPGGHLVLQEITSTQSTCVNIAFGTLPGWWLSTEKWRQKGPLATEESWNQLLQSNGFLGVELTLKDFEDDAHHISTVMVARASGESDTPLRNGPSSVRLAQPQIRIVRDPSSHCQVSLMKELESRFKVTQIVDFDSLGEWWVASPSEVILSLVDVGTSGLASLSEKGFENLKVLIRGSRKILWVAASTTRTSVLDGSVSSLPCDPRNGIATGALRTIRSEDSDKHIVNLTINQGQIYGPKELAAYVTEVMDSCFNNDRSRNGPEVEFVVQDGYISVGRMVYEKELDDERESQIQPRHQLEKWESGPPLVLDTDKPGMLDSLRFVEDISSYDEVPIDEVEIEAEAWPVSFRDIFIALGKVSERKSFGFECAGRVTRVGCACAAQFKPGDRVVMCALGSFRSRPRAKMQALQKIPDDMSYLDVVSHVNPAMTAWYGLVNLARLQKGEKVLIHSAAGATGQMAIGIAKTIGAEIYATVGSDGKKRLLVEELNIPEDCIFHSRDTSFAQGIARVTNGTGVDVVLNSLAGECLRASWECIAPFGRFIEIGKSDIMANSSLPMAKFAKNVTFAAVDLVSLVKTNTKLGRELFTKTMELILNGSLRRPTPLHLYTLGEVEKAFRFMQSGQNTGRIIITRTENAQVTKFLIHRSTWRFDAHATYIVVGGFGGLGRVMLEWMVKKGAKNLLVPSRSGATSQAALDLVTKLRDQNVHISTPECDVSDAAKFSDILKEYTSSTPWAPIKGCINSAMVLRDAVFSNMSHDQWTSTIRSKVQSSWNLHTLLPCDMDFFIMLSSLVGIYGALGQSNYAAGCTFQDALAKARTEASAYQGVSASLDLGWLVDAGIVSEREDYRRKWESAQDIAGVRAADLIAVLDHFCDPARRSILATESSSSCHRSTPCQLLVGALTPAYLAQHGEVIPPTMSPPLLDPFRTIPGTSNFEAGSSASDSQMQSVRTRFRAASSFDARCIVVIDALKGRLARALGVETDDVDPGRLVSSYGVDSLTAVELRNWIRKDFEVDIAVFDILGGATVAGLSRQVATKAEESHKAQ